MSTEDDKAAEIARRHRDNARDNATSVRARLEWFSREYGELIDRQQAATLWSAAETLRAIERSVAQ